jgi:organic radical activating enzyme
MAQENNLLAVNEIFGPTFQGEGKNTGMRERAH